MKFIAKIALIFVVYINSASAQIDTTYLASTPINAAAGTFAFELMNVELSQLTPAQSLWVYGDGNFEIKLFNALQSTHQFRIAPVEEVTLYSVGHYDDGKKAKRRKRNTRSTATLTTPFTPTGGTVTPSGWVEQGHYAALKTFPNVLNHESTPVAIIALYNHQKVPVSGNAFLYYKTNLIKNGVNDIPVSFSVHKEHFNYGNVSATNVSNAPTKPGYQILRSWNYTDLQPEEERHLFVSLDTTPAWQNISDINTANYETEFLLVVTGNGSFAFEKEAVVLSPLEAYHDPAYLDVHFGSDNQEEEITFDLLFYNEGSMPVRNIQVAFNFPSGLKEQDFLVLEKSIGPVAFGVDPDFTEEASLLKFEAKNVGLGKYNPLNSNTYGKITVKAKMPHSRWKEVKASVTFDHLPAEDAQWRNVPELQH